MTSDDLPKTPRFLPKFSDSLELAPNTAAEAGHHWLLDVCDDLIDYCDAHELAHAATQLRHVMIAVLRDAAPSQQAHIPPPHS